MPDGRRLVDYAESSRDGDWSLRSALVRFGQPEPTRAGAVLELVRRTDAALKPHRRRLESAAVPTHPRLDPDLFTESADGSVVVRDDAERTLDAPAADLARTLVRLPEGPAVLAAYADASGQDQTSEAVPLLVVALELDAIADALVPWAQAHDGPPPVDAVDERAAAAFARLAELGVPARGRGSAAGTQSGLTRSVAGAAGVPIAAPHRLPHRGAPAMTSTTEADRTTLAKVAADRAHALRAQAAALNSEALAPLRAALHIRAGELELAAIALGDEAVQDLVAVAPERHLAIA